MGSLIKDGEVDTAEGILHHEEGIDLMLGKIEFAGLEVPFVNAMSREQIVQEHISTVWDYYKYILIDCMPLLGMITINAFDCADGISVRCFQQYLFLPYPSHSRRRGNHPVCCVQ